MVDTADREVEDAAKELIEDSLPAMSTELLTALHYILGSKDEEDIYLTLGEELERRRNAA
jgi:hypothetical protein